MRTFGVFCTKIVVNGHNICKLYEEGNVTDA